MQNVIGHLTNGRRRTGDAGTAAAIVTDGRRIWLGTCTEFYAPGDHPTMRERSNTARWTVWLAAGAMFLAPFIALLYRAEAGLIVMALALGATSLLLHGMLDGAPLRTRRWLRLLVAVNVLLALICLLAAGWFLVRG